MRHPLLHILLALFIGVWSPLCCCQASALAGTVCGGTHFKAPEQDSCCSNCADESQSSEHNAPTNDNRSLPRECPSCPSCQGLASGVMLRAEAKLPTFEQELNFVATIVLSTITSLPRLENSIIPSHALWWASPPHIKANREIQRWHCALTI